MCILIAKPRGAQFPPAVHILNGIENNPDGFSLAYNAGASLVTFKTMSAARFMTKYKALAATLDAAETGMIIHARIATHGSVSLKNCHCWQSFADTDDAMAFAHNGILSVPARDGMTDSETFLRDYFEPAFAAGSWLSASNVIRSKIGASKFAFIDRVGNIRRFGHFISESGCYYSNASYSYRGTRCADPRYWFNANPLAI